MHLLPDLRIAHRVAYLPDGNVCFFSEDLVKNPSLKRFNEYFGKFIPRGRCGTLNSGLDFHLDAVWRKTLIYFNARRALRLWRGGVWTGGQRS